MEPPTSVMPCCLAALDINSAQYEWPPSISSAFLGNSGVSYALFQISGSTTREAPPEAASLIDPGSKFHLAFLHDCISRVRKADCPEHELCFLQDQYLAACNPCKTREIAYGHNSKSSKTKSKKRMWFLWLPCTARVAALKKVASKITLIALLAVSRFSCLSGVTLNWHKAIFTCNPGMVMKKSEICSHFTHLPEGASPSFVPSLKHSRA